MKKKFSIYQFFVRGFLFLVSLSMIIPVIMVVSTSFSPQKEVLKYGMRFIPTTGISFESFEYVFGAAEGFMRAYGITLFVTVVGTCLSLIITCMSAYGLSKNAMPGRKFLFFFCFFTMLFNGGLIPGFMVVRNVGLYNTIWALIVPSVMSIWYMILMINFFQSIPASLEESAKIDGANDIVVLVRIMIPLSLPSIATIALFYAVGYWNQWFASVIYTNKPALRTLQVLIKDMISSIDFAAMFGITIDPSVPPPPGLMVKCAAVVVTMFPIMVLYPFLQKYFVKGVMVGAVKG